MTPRRLVAAAAVLLLVSIGVLGGVLLAGRGGPSGVDTGFARDMSEHHRQAVLMASLVADRSDDPAVELLAYDILTTQSSQVGQMQGWLQAWGEPAVSDDSPMAWMAHPVPSAAEMPGMASAGDLEHLRSLSGTGFDVEFLRLMRTHHVGALDMAAVAAADASRPEVRDLAEKIDVGQTAEVHLLEDMLSERGVDVATLDPAPAAGDMGGMEMDHSGMDGMEMPSGHSHSG